MKNLLCRLYKGIKVLTVLALFSCFAVFAGSLIYFEFIKSPAEKNLPEEFVLRFTLENIVEESSNDSPFRYLGKGHPLALRTFIESLERARADKRITGMVIKAGDVGLRLAHAEEMRACLQRFKDSGKFVIFYTDTFGEGGDDQSVLYYLASVASEIWIQPTGRLCLTGLSSETPFLKTMMDLVGIKAEIAQRHEYKSAPNTFLYSDMPELQRESELRMLKSMQNQIDLAAADSRNIESDAFAKLRAFRPLSAEEALAQKFITHVGYWSDCLRRIKGVNLDLSWVKFTDYVNTLSPIESKGRKLALIVVDGAIERGKTPPLDAQGSSIGGDTVAKAIRQSLKDEEVGAIVLRIDSPGGSHIASDTMWYEVKEAKKAGIPLIVSMGPLAASGGYFVAMAADHIIANAATLTGSIGAYSGKYVAEDLLQKIGVHIAPVDIAENATMTAMFKKFTPGQWAILNHELDETYKDFTTKFQECRNIPEISVDGLARGRVYAGSDAISLGLVDQIGGYYDAILEAKKAAKIPLHEPASIQLFPKPKTLTERVLEYFEDVEDVSRLIRSTQDMILDGVKALKGVHNRVQYTSSS